MPLIAQEVTLVPKKDRLRVFAKPLEDKNKDKSKFQGVSDHSLMMDLYRVLPNIVIKVRGVRIVSE